MEEHEKQAWRPKNWTEAYTKIYYQRNNEAEFTQDLTKYVELISQNLPLNADALTFEWGCGIGRLAKPLSTMCKKYHGVDLTDEMVNLCTTRMASEIKANKFEVVKCDGTHLPYADNTFDCGLSVYVLQHNPRENMIFMLADMHRVLKPQGKLFIQISDIEKPDGWGLFMKVANDYQHHRIKGGYMNHQNLHKEEFKFWCKQLGFINIEEVHSDTCSTFFTIQKA